MNYSDDDDGRYPPDPNFKGRHYKISQILPGEIQVNQSASGILEPFCITRIILSNGAMYALPISAFRSHDEFIRKLWNEKPSAFQKVEQN